MPAGHVTLHVASLSNTATMPTLPTIATATPIHLLELTTHIRCCPCAATALTMRLQMPTPASNHLPTTPTLIHSPTSHSEPTIHCRMNAAIAAQASSTLTHRGVVHHISNIGWQ